MFMDINEITGSVKKNNRVVVLNAMRRYQEVSIATLTKCVGLSKPTIKKIIDHYLYMGLVKEAGKGTSSEEGGKKPVLYRFNEDYACVIALHLGPRFIYAAVLNLRGEFTHSAFFNIDPNISYQQVIDTLGGYIERYTKMNEVQGIPVSSVVIALPGITDPETGVMLYSPHFESWDNNVPFKEVLQEKLTSDIPIYIDNVNRYQAFVEMLKGHALGVKNFAIIDALEEGVGAGIIVDGSLRHGSQNIAGEIGHCIVNTHDGAECICGAKGCLEAELSWRNICRLIEAGKAEYPESKLFAAVDLPSPEGFFAVAREGDELAVAVLDKITTYFARGINNLIMVNDPQLIILQGIYNQAGNDFLQAISAKINTTSLLSMGRDIELLFSDYKLDRGVMGAGLYGLWEYFKELRIRN